MKKYSKGELFFQVENARKKGTQPSLASFHCLMELKDEEITTLQKEVNKRYISFLRNKWDIKNVIDMEPRTNKIVQDRVLKEELLHLFNASLSQGGSVMKTWKELVGHYDITNEIFYKVMCVHRTLLYKKTKILISSSLLVCLGKFMFLGAILNLLSFYIVCIGITLQLVYLYWMEHMELRSEVVFHKIWEPSGHFAKNDEVNLNNFFLLSFLTRQQITILEDTLERMSCRYDISN